MPEPEKSPEAGPTPSGPDEVRTIRQLVRLMHRYDLTAIDLDQADSRIRLRRRGAEVAQHAPPPPPATPAALHPTPATPSNPTAPAPAPAAVAGTFILSPMVGTFYAASGPDTPPYVSVGSAVRPEGTVCVIEAMKVFTEIPAGLAGTIAEVLVQNGQAVEFDQPLFRVNPA